MKDNWLFYLSLLTLFCALAWVGFDAYHAYTTTTVTAPLEEIALPITPTIDNAAIEKLKQRREPVRFTPPGGSAAGPVVPVVPTASPAGNVGTTSGQINYGF